MRSGSAPAGVLAAGGAGAAWIGTRPEPPIPIGGPFQLIDGDGKTVTDQDFRGKWMLVYFGYTHCPDACPTALQDMANARRHDRRQEARRGDPVHHHRSRSGTPRR